jgi:hypothetical protein
MGVVARGPLDVVAAADSDLIPSDADVGVLTSFGVQAVVAYRKDEPECRRRRAQAMPALVRPDVLDLLMSLPLGEAVARESLSDSELRALKHVPKGAMTRSGSWVKRLAVQPLQIDLVIVPGKGWEAAMEKAERFTPFCARAVLVDRPLRRREDAIMRAAYFGIGLLVVGDGHTVDVVVPPQPFVRKRYTPAAWQFVEEAYRQLG